MSPSRTSEDQVYGAYYNSSVSGYVPIMNDARQEKDEKMCVWCGEPAPVAGIDFCENCAQCHLKMRAAIDMVCNATFGDCVVMLEWRKTNALEFELKVRVKGQGYVYHDLPDMFRDVFQRLTEFAMAVARDDAAKSKILDAIGEAAVTLGLDPYGEGRRAHSGLPSSAWIEGQPSPGATALSDFAPRSPSTCSSATSRG